MPARSRRDREAVEVHRRAPRVPHARASTPSSRAAPAGAASTTAATSSCSGTRSSRSSRSPGSRRAARTRSRRRSGRRTTWPRTSCGGIRPSRPATSSTSRSRSTTPTATSSRSSGSSNGRGSSSPGPAARPSTRRGDVAGVPPAPRRARRGETHGVERDQTPRLEALRPGDVVLAPRRGGKVVVLKQDRGRGRQPRARAHRRARPRAARSERLPRPGTQGRLDSTCRGRSRRAARRSNAPAADALRRLTDRRPPTATTRPATTASPHSKPALRAHPLHDSPGLAPRLRAATQADRIEREVARLERRVGDPQREPGPPVRPRARRARGVGLPRRVGAERRGRAARPAQHRRRPRARGVAARGTARRLRPARAGRARVVLHVPAARTRRQRAAAAAPLAEHRSSPAALVPIERVWRDLNLAERDERLPETRRPDPGFTEAIHAWATGDDLADVLEDEEMTGGDFVRNVKQTIDLLRQVADVAPDPGHRGHRPVRRRCLPARRRRGVERRRRPRVIPACDRQCSCDRRRASRGAGRRRRPADEVVQRRRPRARRRGRGARRARCPVPSRRRRRTLRRAVGLAPGGRPGAGVERRRRHRAADGRLALDDGTVAVNMVVLGRRPNGCTRSTPPVDGARSRSTAVTGSRAA